MWLPGSLAALVHDHHIESAPPGQIEQQKEAPAPVPEPPSPPAPTQPADEKPSGDPHVCMAFATGWQMTEVYKSARRIEDGAKAPLGPPPEDTGLHCLRQLDAVDRATLAVGRSRSRSSSSAGASPPRPSIRLTSPR